LTCTTTWLKYELTKRISVYDVRSQKIYMSFDLLELKCITVQRQSSGRFYESPDIGKCLPRTCQKRDIPQ